MQSFARYRVISAFLFICLGYSATTLSSENYSDNDVLSLDGIINAYYEVISGPKGFKYDTKKDQFIHAPNAIITRFNEMGEFQRHTLLDEQKSLLEPYSESLYEVEVNRVVEEYGSIVHVWSTFEMRESPDSNAFLRGINSISLYFKDDRWWIASWSTQYEDDIKVPEKYLPQK